jgi:YidC/Oxa1 family membrane protein insertase
VPDEAPDDEAVADQQQRPPPLQLSALGSLDPDSPYQMLVVFSNQGASIHSVELNSPHYRELNRRFGYLGYLGLTDDGGCRVGIVGDGSPAALAKCMKTKGGLLGPTYKTVNDQTMQTAPGDLITRLGDNTVDSLEDFDSALQRTRAGVDTEIEVQRTNVTGQSERLTFVVTPTKAPLSLIRIEPTVPSEETPLHPGSFLTSLCQVGPEKVRFGEEEIKGLTSLRNAIWTARQLPAKGALGPGIEFKTTLSQPALRAIGQEGPIAFTKRYRLAQVTSDNDLKHQADGYRLTMQIEIQNLASSDQKIAYQIEGPTGITTEGWWYSYKTHPARFVSAGARDIAWREQGEKHKLFVNSEITKTAKDDEDSPNVPMTDSESIKMRYAGVDTQYFAAVLLPPAKPGEDSRDVATDEFESATAMAVGPLDDRLKRTDVTFRLKSRLTNVGSGESISRDYDIFMGPKEEQVLAQYALNDFIVYGWFGWVSKPMLSLLHGLYWITGSFSYGLAIILLTVMVRGCMFPLGRKMALNAQKMQSLAPEMKKIADKYKNDLEKRSAAQKELFAKHKYNPFSGCLVMVIQMPVFLGLYRGLSCDIALRQAPLIPGMSWCSNLAGPDMFWYWKPFVPEFLSSPHGIFGLGPYLNILPLFTVVLFIAQQKLFTPPPQDEQQKMQHQIMKFMMIFMGLIFFKVASGLCIYIIASTMWGLAERLLLPKPSTVAPTEKPEVTTTAKKSDARGSNGAAARKKKRRKKQKRR